jgi:membrane fusion protein, multidrug efflux system
MIIQREYRDKHMKRSYFSMIAAVAVLVTIVLSSCGGDAANSAMENKGNGEQNPVTVSVMEIQASDFSEILQLTGTIASFEDINVPSDEGGRVLQWLVPRGAAVRKGQTLVQLDSAIARATYDAALAQFNIASNNYERQKRVFEQQGISELQLNTLQYQRDAAKAQMDMALERLARTRIKSPINGTLNMRYVETGEMSAPGMPIAHIVNTDRLKIDAGVPERYAGSFAKGDKVEFTVDAFPEESYTGTVGFIAAAVNKDNRSIPVEIFITSAGGRLKPEMIAALRLTLGSRSNVIAIPEDYVLKTNIDEFVVYIVDGDVARERNVTLGPWSQGRVLITDGLEAGDKLITIGFQNVADGQPVLVRQ